MSYINQFSGVNPETMTRDFNAYIALTLDETLTIELRTKALLSYLTEIAGLLSAANTILADLTDLVKYETDVIFQGWITDGTLAAIINQILTPIITNMQTTLTQNFTTIANLTTVNNTNAATIINLATTINGQMQALVPLLNSYEDMQSVGDNTLAKYKTLTDTINQALNTITLIQNRLTASENNLGSLQDQVNSFSNQYNTLSQNGFPQAIIDLQTAVNNAQTLMENALEEHTGNITNVVNLYANLTTAVQNLTSFADSARQFQESILAVINFIDQHQDTVNSNQNAITTLLNQINTLLSYHFDYTSQVALMDGIRNRPNFVFNTIPDSSGVGFVNKYRMGGAVTYNGLTAMVIGGANATNVVFTDPELGFINTISGTVAIDFRPSAMVYIVTPTTVMGLVANISSTGVVTAETGGIANALVYVNFSIYIPLQEVN